MSVPTSPLQLEGIRFKGDRNYLQGADILSSALYALADGQSLERINDIDIVFHALACTGLTLQENVLPGCEPKGQLRCSIDGLRQKFFLVEDCRPITQRHPYPEDQIVADTTLDIDSVSATSLGNLPFTNIERWIAMIKALHHAAYPEAQGKWLFARAKLTSYKDSYGKQVEHRTSIESNFAGKLTRSSLTVDGRKIGDIFFALT